METPQAMAESAKGQEPIGSYKEPPWEFFYQGFGEWTTHSDQTT
jgi:hypothetical protein